MITEVKKHCNFPNSPGIFSLVFYRDFIPRRPEFSFFLELYTWNGVDPNSSQFTNIIIELDTEERLRFVDVLKASLLGNGNLETFTANDHRYTIDVLRKNNMTSFEMTISLENNIYKGVVEYNLLISINDPLRGMLQRPTGTEAELHHWNYKLIQE